MPPTLSPGRARVAEAQEGFVGGLNTVSDPASVAPNQATQLTNCRLTTYGAAIRRGGTQKMSASTANGSSAVTGMQWWDSQLKFVAVVGTNLYTAGPTVPVTWTNVASAAGLMLSDPSMRTFYGASAIDTMYIADGDAAGLKSYNSSATFTNGISGTPTVNGIEVYNQRLWGWFWGNSVGSNSLYYSNLAFAAGSIGGDSLGVAASGGGLIRVVTFGASGIIVCRAIGASLMIFHIRGVSRLTGFGQSDLSVQPQAVTPDFAIVGRDAIAVHDNLGYAVSMNGLFVVSEGAITPVGTPERPDPLPAALLQASGNSTQSTTVVYDVLKNEVRIGIVGVGVYIYHVILGAWSGPFTGSVYVTGTARQYIFPGNQLNNMPAYVIQVDASGWAYKTDVATYKDAIAADGTGGSAYSMVVQPHRMYGIGETGGRDSRDESWRWITVTANLTTGGTAPSLASTTTLGSTNNQTFSTPTTGEKNYYLQGAGVGNWIDVVITDSAAASSSYSRVEVEGFALGRR